MRACGFVLFSWVNLHGVPGIESPFREIYHWLHCYLMLCSLRVMCQLWVYNMRKPYASTVSHIKTVHFVKFH